MQKSTLICSLGVGLSALLQYGCGEVDPAAPPVIRLGDTACTECGMIVSDDRFGTATVINGDRGQETLIFDDFSCQMKFEAKHPDLQIVTRWSRDYGTLEWLHTQNAWFVHASELHTPMASNMAAFKARSDAEKAAQELGGTVCDFNECATFIRSVP
ncbi:MAG: nitrous oxide reductase accessory protein NosL [Phycisphaerales bacterium]|nr:nitrous oxide reductase accessory protein NosL [Phycisphaerales bacterium]